MEYDKTVIHSNHLYFKNVILQQTVSESGMQMKYHRWDEINCLQLKFRLGLPSLSHKY